MKVLLKINLFLALFVLTFSVEMVVNRCGDKSIYHNLPCTINRVESNGCNTGRAKECKLKRGQNGSISIDFTPDFDATEAELIIYSMFPREIPWPGMNTNACDFMTCPVVKGVENNYNFSMPISRTYPTGLFPVRFVMKVADKPVCCFISKFRIDRDDDDCE